MANEPTNSAPPAYRPLAQALRRLGPGRNGRPTHLATGIRWATEGVRLTDGSRLRLGAKRLPGRWVITDEALDEFVDRLTSDRAGQADPNPTSSPAVRSGAADKAGRELDRIGIR